MRLYQGEEEEEEEEEGGGGGRGGGGDGGGNVWHEEEEEEEEEEKKKTEEGKNISVKEITEIGLFNVFSLSMKPTELNIGGKDAAERCERIC